MNLFNVMAEVAVACRTVPGLSGRVFDWNVGSLSSPAVIVGLPDEIKFDETYSRGNDKFSDLIVMLLLGKGDQRSAQKSLGPYIAGAGASSFKQVLDGYAWTTCHAVVLKSITFDEVTWAGVPYLAANFHTDIWGSGIQ